MLKPIIAAAAAFAIFAAAGTGVGMLRAPKHVATDSTLAAADSTHDGADAGVLESGELVLNADAGVDHASDAEAEAAHTELAATGIDATSPAAPTTSGLGAPDASVAARATAGLQVRPTAAVAAADSMALERTGKVAKLFQSMSARDAAKVLEQMADQDVITILSALPERRAGEILALMSAERSALLTRSMLARGNGASK